MQAFSTDYAAEHPGNQEFARDPERPREHSRVHADRAGRGHARLGDQGRESGNVSISLVLEKVPSEGS